MDAVLVWWCRRLTFARALPRVSRLAHPLRLPPGVCAAASLRIEKTQRELLYLQTQPLAPPAQTSSVQNSAPLTFCAAASLMTPEGTKGAAAPTFRAMSQGIRREEMAGHSTSVFIHHCGSASNACSSQHTGHNYSQRRDWERCVELYSLCRRQARRTSLQIAHAHTSEQRRSIHHMTAVAYTTSTPFRRHATP